MPVPEKAYVAALNSIGGIGYKTVTVLMELFGSAEAVLKAEEGQLKAKGCSDTFIARLVAGRKGVDALKLYEQVLFKGIDLITVFDPEYPFLLQQTPNPPTVLYVKGRLPQVPVNVAIVGTRTATVYGTNAARSLASRLAGRNVCIVSGMARGIDTAAHKGALDARGSTVAVFGCGLDRVYPPENRALAQQIAEEGALISEFPLGMPPERGNFPARNRIISGLSHGVVVVEAPQRSGALITADFALEQGREVFAIPGPISSRSSEGCNQLIQEGAKLVQRVEDILEELQGVGAGAEEPVESGAAAGVVEPGGLGGEPGEPGGVIDPSVLGSDGESGVVEPGGPGGESGEPSGVIDPSVLGSGGAAAGRSDSVIEPVVAKPGDIETRANQLVQITLDYGAREHSQNVGNQEGPDLGSHSVGSSSHEIDKNDVDDKRKEEILHLLSGDSVYLDELCTHCGLSPAEMSILITKLEIEGLVCKSGGRICAQTNRG